MLGMIRASTAQHERGLDGHDVPRLEGEGHGGDSPDGVTDPAADEVGEEILAARVAIGDREPANDVDRDGDETDRDEDEERVDLEPVGSGAVESRLADAGDAAVLQQEGDQMVFVQIRHTGGERANRGDNDNAGEAMVLHAELLGDEVGGDEQDDPGRRGREEDTAERKVECVERAEPDSEPQPGFFAVGVHRPECGCRQAGHPHREYGEPLPKNQVGARTKRSPGRDQVEHNARVDREQD